MRSASERLQRRRAALQALVDAGSDAEVAAARFRVWSRSRIDQVRVRSGFVVRAEPEAPLPPIRRVLAARSVAVQVQLTLLFEAQCAVRWSAGRPTKRPLIDSRVLGVPAWVDLVASHSAESTRLPRGATAKQNRLRQVKAALVRLAEHDLVEIGHGYDRFSGFRLLHEGAPASRPHTYYSVPDPGESLFLPVDFFLNGWVHALTDNEISLYLAIRLMTQRLNIPRPDRGVFLPYQLRTEAFGFDRAAYEAHRILGRVGLIVPTMDPKRSLDDGRMSGWTSGQNGDFHRFTLRDDGLGRPAVPTVLAALDRQRDGVSLSTALNENASYRHYALRGVSPRLAPHDVSQNHGRQDWPAIP
jgi:hypothetical protein